MKDFLSSVQRELKGLKLYEYDFHEVEKDNRGIYNQKGDIRHTVKSNDKNELYVDIISETEHEIDKYEICGVSKQSRLDITKYTYTDKVKQSLMYTESKFNMSTDKFNSSCICITTNQNKSNITYNCNLNLDPDEVILKLSNKIKILHNGFKPYCVTIEGINKKYEELHTKWYEKLQLGYNGTFYLLDKLDKEIHYDKITIIYKQSINNVFDLMLVEECLYGEPIYFDGSKLIVERSIKGQTARVKLSHKQVCINTSRKNIKLEIKDNGYNRVDMVDTIYSKENCTTYRSEKYTTDVYKEFDEDGTYYSYEETYENDRKKIIKIKIYYRVIEEDGMHYRYSATYKLSKDVEDEPRFYLGGY